MEQDIIENVSAAYLEFMIIFFTFILCNSLVRTLQYLKKKLNIFFAPENMKKTP